jgi:hypothetical protein
MADETKPPQALAIAPLPDVFTIPAQLIEQWGQIPQTDTILSPLTRQDIDHLLVGLLRSLDAQTAIDRALTEWSNGKLDDANSAIATARRLNIDSQNHIRQLATAIMASALRSRQNAK